MIRKLILIFSFFLATAGIVISQEKPKFLTLNGYFSMMQSVMFDSVSGPFVVDNLVAQQTELQRIYQ